VKDPGAPKLHELIHRVALCSQQDIVAGPSTMELRRESVVWTWARVKSHYGLPAIVARSGYTIWGSANVNTVPTHAITVRAGIGVEITAMAYVYEEGSPVPMAVCFRTSDDPSPLGADDCRTLATPLLSTRRASTRSMPATARPVRTSHC